MYENNRDNQTLSEVIKMSTPFLAKFKSDKNDERIVLVTDNKYNLFKGIYLKGQNKGMYTEGLNCQFLEVYRGEIALNNEMLNKCFNHDNRN